MTEKPSDPLRPDPSRASNDEPEERRRAEFANRLTRDIFGRFYWDDRMTDEIRKALKRRR